MESQTGYHISCSLVPLLHLLYNILRTTPVYVTSDIQLQRYCEFFLLLFAGWPGSTLSRLVYEGANARTDGVWKQRRLRRQSARSICMSLLSVCPGNTAPRRNTTQIKSSGRLSLSLCPVICDASDSEVRSDNVSWRRNESHQRMDIIGGRGARRGAGKGFNTCTM